MNEIYLENPVHSNDIQDIVEAPPKWLLRWGISLFFALTVMLIGLSAIITYPDIVRSSLKINSAEVPTILRGKTSGRLLRLLVPNNSIVKKGQALAYLGVAPIHAEIIKLLGDLKALQSDELKEKTLPATFNTALNINTPERIQHAYKAFLYAYSACGFSMKQRVKSSSKYHLRLSIAINTLINEIEHWKDKYVLTSPSSGSLFYVGFLKINQALSYNQEIFYISCFNNKFFGEMTIPQNRIGKVKVGQTVLIKVRSYPYEEFGILYGKIKHIADFPYMDSVFIAEVDISNRRSAAFGEAMPLKIGMKADAEIVTQNATVLQRIVKSIIKITR